MSRIPTSSLSYLKRKFIGIGDVPDFDAPLITSINPRFGQGLPSFTRASTATVTDFEGRIITVKSGEARFEGARRVENLLQKSESFDNAVWEKNSSGSGSLPVVTANAFANPVDGMVTADQIRLNRGVGNTTNDESGISIVNTPNSISAGKLYSGSFYAKGTAGEQVLLRHVGRTNYTTITFTGQWQRISAQEVAFNNNISFELTSRGEYSSTNDVTFYAWGAQLEEVTGQTNQNPSEYVSTNVKTSAPYHGANVDGVKYFATLCGNTVTNNVVTEATGAAIPDVTLKGYLAEEQRANLLLRSEEFDNASWEKAPGFTFSATNVLAPNGQLTAERFNCNSSSDTWDIRQNCFVTSGQTYIFSIYVKLGTATNFVVVVNNTLAWDTIGGKEFTASDGLNTSNYTRLTYTFTAPTTSAVNIHLSKHANTGVGAQTTGTVDVWGAQLEQAAFSSSYIPTTSASVTRDADVLTYQVGGNIIDLSGSAYAEVTSSNWSNVTGQYLGDGVEAVLQASTSNSGVQVYDGTNTVNGPTGTPSGQMRVASSWIASVLKAFSNGIKGTDGSYDGSFNLAQLNIGSGYNGTIKNVKLWKKVLTNTQLTQLTK